MTYLYKKPALVAFLLFCVASSTHVILYNEELLVAGTFLGFVIYIKTAFGNSIKESIDESRNSILQELQSLAVHKKNGALHLKTIHQKVPAIHKSLCSIEKYINTYVFQIGDIATKSINRTAHQQLELRCQQAKSGSQFLFAFYQEKMSISFLPSLLHFTQKNSYLNKKKSIKFSILDSGEGAIKTARRSIELLKKAKK